jgi:hypothetical protein
MKPAPTLFDTLYRASFSKRNVMGWRDNNAMQQALIGARRFVLDDRMSSFLGDLSSAGFAGGYKPKVGARLVEQMRISARLPHSAVWIEYDLHKAQIRSRELLGKAVSPFDPAESPQKEGWLLQQHPTLETAICMHIFSQNPGGKSDSFGFDTWTFPVMYTWTVDDRPSPWPSIFKPGGAADSILATGIAPYISSGVTIAQSPLLASFKNNELVSELVQEWAGVMRRTWALLSTINDIPILATDVRQSKGFFAKGQIRKFLSYQTLTLNVPVKKDTRVLARQLIALARKRAHQVRAHWRHDWRNPGNQSCKHEWDIEQRCRLCRAHRIWVHEHQRGDPSLGIIFKDYIVTHEAAI